MISWPAEKVNFPHYLLVEVFGVISEYLNDIPEDNIFELRDPSGEPIVGARIEVHQASGLPLWYGKYFDSEPDIVRFTNTEGRASVGSFPSGGGDGIVHGYGHSNAVILLKLTSEQESNYQFFEVTEVNEAFWSGHHNSATYVITADLPQGSLPPQVFLPTVLAGSLPSESFLESNLRGSFTHTGPSSGTATGLLGVDDAVVGFRPMTPKEPTWVTRRWEVHSAD